MTKQFIVANWKMNLPETSLADYVDILQDDSADNNILTQIILCPPFPFLASLQNVLTQTSISLGAQTVSAHEKGAYTGDVSAHMLQKVGAQYVICGHSEQRHYHNFCDEDVNVQARQVQSVGLTPIICVGEPLSVFETHQTHGYLQQQIKTTTAGLAPNMIIAYEPLWAIGTGHTPQLEDVEKIAQKLQPHLPPETPILYGGSVKAENAQSFMRLSSIQGLLVGGASLDPYSFKNLILRATSNTI